MEKKDTLTKTLAITGTVLVWLPLIAPTLFSLVRLLQGGIWRFDYLIPAELFPAVILGSVLLIGAAMRAHVYQRLLAWGLGMIVVMLVGSQVAAVLTGLASGETEPAGWPLWLVAGGLILYTLAALFEAIGGTLLVRDLYRAPGAAG